jgi:hypothetical protein
MAGRALALPNVDGETPLGLSYTRVKLAITGSYRSCDTGSLTQTRNAVAPRKEKGEPL